MIRTTLKEFRDFALKGNVVDLSVAVILGLAFGLVVTSMVNDVLMPPIGRLAGNLDFSNLYVSLSDKLDADNRAKATTQPAIQSTTDSVVGEVTSFVKPSNRLSLEEVRQKGYAVIAYGKFITAVINFVIQAFCVFMLIKGMTTIKKRFDKEQVVAPPPPPADVQLLTEIRDLLKKQQA